MTVPNTHSAVRNRLASSESGGALRIVMLCGGNRVFGMETMALSVAIGLRARGHDVSVIANGWNDGVFPARLREAGLPYDTIFLGRISKSLNRRSLVETGAALKHLIGARRRCAELLAAAAPDVIIVYNRDWIVLTESILRRYPVVFHVQELASSRIAKLLYRRADSAIDAYVAASRNLQARLAEIGIDRRKLRIAHNGIPDAAPPRELEPRIRRSSIGIVGQVGEWKGHEDLLDALAIVRKRGTSVTCRVFGTGDPSYLEHLRAQAARLEIDDLISWEGYVRDRSTIYDAIDVCVVPSRFEEPFGLVAVEAAMHGIPVVASRCGGLEEIVEDERTGFLVTPRNAAELADRIELLANNPELRVRLGTAGIERAREFFTTDSMVSAIEQACRDVWASRSSGDRSVASRHQHAESNRG
jgi:glycosyltransferase involved in cell wall biosynthesis